MLHPKALGLRSLALLGLLALVACNRPTTESKSAESAPPAGSLELLFPYGSEKEEWIADVTQTFNRGNHQTKSGKNIYVTAKPMGSGESMDEVLSGRMKAHIFSPASAAFIKLGNAQSRTQTGKDLVGATQNLVLSPVVIAMWKPMAEALGWPAKPVGWADVIALARNPQGWAAYNYPQWGRFKFGHTHPEYSNSGLISLLAEAYAGVHKTRDLTLADVDRPATAEFIGAIEQTVVHYGSSTGFFGRAMFDNGPQYLSAAVLYESMVVESYSQANLAFPVVAIYPKEGTFWSDHPIGIVERDWVTPEHREAADIYIRYLLDKPQQQKALTYGFRPASVDVPVGAPIDAQHGVNPAEPKTTLEVPSVEVINRILTLWQIRKKHADVVLVLDTSGSMNDEHKMENAKIGAKQFIAQMSNLDTFSFLPFSSDLHWSIKNLVLQYDGKAQATAAVDSLFADGNTRLYDAIDGAYTYLKQSGNEGKKIQAVVVLTDGADTDSKMKLDDLLKEIRFNGENNTIRIFTIAYGEDAMKDVLAQIAESTKAKSYVGNPRNIAGVFRDVSTFF
jgi:Ca-activated chloride channel family protein